MISILDMCLDLAENWHQIAESVNMHIQLTGWCLKSSYMHKHSCFSHKLVNSDPAYEEWLILMTIDLIPSNI